MKIFPDYEFIFLFLCVKRYCTIVDGTLEFLLIPFSRQAVCAAGCSLYTLVLTPLKRGNPFFSSNVVFMAFPCPFHWIFGRN